MIHRSGHARWLVPETLQTSTTDCGPAALRSLLEGMGIHASYTRLREACQTDVDGTSIDGLEGLCLSLGLEAEQMVVPRDHLLLEPSRILPCIVVVKSRLGPHFVVVWNVVGPWVQTMDPSYGRRWQLIDAFLGTLMPFALPVDAAAWRTWAESDEYSGAIKARLSALHLPKTRRDALLERAHTDTTWKGLAHLDASLRFTAQLVKSGGLRRGGEASRLLEALSDPARQHDAEIPEAYWSVRPSAPDHEDPPSDHDESAPDHEDPPSDHDESAPDHEDPPSDHDESAPDHEGEEQLSLRGAVVLRVRAPKNAPQDDNEPPQDAAPDPDATAPHAQSPQQLASAIADTGPSLRDHLLALLRADGPRERLLLLGLLLVGTLGVVVELVLFRTLIDLMGRLGLASHRLQALGVVLVFTLSLLLLDIPAMSLVLRAGRRLELRLRLGFAERLPRLADRYLQSRLVSDLAGRLHHATRIRQLPDVLWQLARAGMELLMTAVALAWLDPRLLPHLGVVVTLGVLIPLLTYNAVQEHDYRVRTLSGSLYRFYLDALQGLFPVLTHGAERGVQSEHDQIMSHWETASHALLRVRMGAEGLQLLVGLGSAVWLVHAHLRHVEGHVGSVLLVVYLALNLPALGQRLSLLTRQFVRLRNYSFILLETLAEPLQRPPSAALTRASSAPPPPRVTGIQLDFQQLSVVSGGKERLASLDLSIRPGEHIAVVGPSGAGKSSLFGLLLGWVEPTDGHLLLDGEPLSPAVLTRLTEHLAWVDPVTQLWNRPLLDNLTYAAPGRSVGETIDAVDLRTVLGRLPQGLQTSLGEGGRLLSGGEGQRVRLGRAHLQHDARLVLLDEAFRGLDLPVRKRLLRMARARWRDATLLCITHDIEEALAFDRVLVIDDGRLVEDGDPRVLARTQGTHYHTLLTLKASLQGALSAPAWRQVVVSAGRIAPPSPPGATP
ncbi:ATP-binding cassette domain-containing protein [Chondromyces crocatus]|uniref:ABC transporter ATP-binding protein n=1 Tax=Chondromyces crocatus TaxID=52 RepID=A0A0K1ENB4_CHOCO|nr:ATP-binding cassette domain-containing protein [Chondromyces crocatus]AKT42425.1 ABC transporter ATP-binding protein [Chondromyces crocatus]